MLKRFLKGGDDKTLLSAERLMLIVSAGILIALALVQLSTMRAHNRDAQRKTDLYTLQLAVQKYFAVNGVYPTRLADITDLPASDCKDPKGKGNCQNPDYSYKAFALNTKPSSTTKSNCDNKKAACLAYTLYSNSMETSSNPYQLTSN